MGGATPGQLEDVLGAGVALPLNIPTAEGIQNPRPHHPLPRQDLKNTRLGVEKLFLAPITLKEKAVQQVYTYLYLVGIFKLVLNAQTHGHCGRRSAVVV